MLAEYMSPSGGGRELFQLAYYSDYARNLSRGLMNFQLNSIIRVSNSRNKLANVTGALLFAKERFVQFLEGEEASVIKTFRRITLDDRHRDIYIVSMGPANKRYFERWWMGCGEWTPKTEALLEPFLEGDRLAVEHLSIFEIRDLLVEIGNVGFERQSLLACAASIRDHTHFAATRSAAGDKS